MIRSCARLAAAACLLALAPAWAALIDRERAQLVLMPVPQPPRQAVMQAPEERTLQAGDLISVFVPDQATLTFTEGGKPTAAVVPLDEARYRELSAQGGGLVAEPGLPAVRGHGWQRFGAARAGVVHLQVRHAGAVKWYRLAIGEAPVFSYGRVVTRTDQQQGEALALTDHDQLVLDLPGEAGDGWTVGPAARSGLTLVSLVPAAQGRVKLTLAVVRGDGRPESPSLDIASGARRFVFDWSRAAIPLAR